MVAGFEKKKKEVFILKNYVLLIDLHLGDIIQLINAQSSFGLYFYLDKIIQYTISSLRSREYLFLAFSFAYTLRYLRY